MLRILGLLILTVLTACSKKPLSPGLVSTSNLGTLRGQHFVRVITHFHSPYSFDACDGQGIRADGSINLECLHDAKTAFCENHINFVFMTDHMSHLSTTGFQDLVLSESGDTVILNGSDPVGTQIHCADGFNAVMFPGLEGKLLGLGMQQHVASDQASREAIYGAEDGAARDALTVTAGALVAVPHTESRDLLSLIALQPKAIEIYNLHANLDPKIRKKYLHRNPFDKVGKFINYLADPFNSLNPDYLFLDFLEFNDVYFQTWDAMLAAGLETTGLGGLDSHENIFKQAGADGQRLDHHRRMTRFMNNLALTAADDEASVKSAIQNGKVFFVIEGLGTPYGLDFHGTVNSPGGELVTEMGGTMSPSGSSSSLSFTVPSVIAGFPGLDSEESPAITAELIYVNGAGIETVVARTSSGQLNYADPPAGHYRVQVRMKPRHLRDFLFNTDHADEEYLWIISNHIKVVP
jgi:hypothetical protein